eukprot:14196668-Ditylum_brightwellii.AAC.1
MHHTTSEYAKYYVHLCTGNTFAKIARQRYETEASKVFVRQPFSMLASELTQEIAPMISLKSKVKFVLETLKYDPMIKNNVDHYKTLIGEQNVYLTNDADFRIGGISKAILNVNVSRKTVRENILLSPFIMDMHLMVYADSKGIWTTESTAEDLYKVLKDAETSLKVLTSLVQE